VWPDTRFSRRQPHKTCPKLNADLQTLFDDALGDLQSVTGETVTLAGIDYTCTAATAINGSLEFFQGGAADMQNVSLCIRQSDLPVQPAVNALAVFHGINFRVKSVDDAGALWQIMLIQEFA
jgi:hypothetical protein